MEDRVDGKSRFHNGDKFVDINDFIVQKVTLSDYPINTKLTKFPESVEKFYQTEEDIPGATNTLKSKLNKFDINQDDRTNMNKIIVYLNDVSNFPEATSENPQFIRVKVADDDTQDTTDQALLGGENIKNGEQLLKYINRDIVIIH